MSEFTDLSVTEQEARIRQLQADALLKALDSVKRAQDIHFGPRALLAQGSHLAEQLDKQRFKVGAGQIRTIGGAARRKAIAPSRADAGTLNCRVPGFAPLLLYPSDD